MTHMTMSEEFSCGGEVQRALVLNAVWWASFVGALIAAWTFWPEAREALAHGLAWLGIAS